MKDKTIQRNVERDLESISKLLKLPGESDEFQEQAVLGIVAELVGESELRQQKRTDKAE